MTINTTSALSGNYLERVEYPAKEFFAASDWQSRPLVIGGAMDGWPAFSRWDADYFAGEYGNMRVQVRRSGNPSDMQRMSLREYIGYFKVTDDRDPYYFSDWEFSAQCPELNDAFATPKIFVNWLDRYPDYLSSFRWIFIGPAGSYSSLHVDTMMTAGWNGLLRGEKIWHFYPPDAGRNVYGGAVNSFKPDPAAFPLAGGLTPLLAVQKRGDIVYTPSGWWHQVYNAGPSIALAENFINSGNVATVKNFLALNEQHQELRLLEELESIYSAVKQ